jgi:hypothetical protein
MHMDSGKCSVSPFVCNTTGGGGGPPKPFCFGNHRKWKMGRAMRPEGNISRSYFGMMICRKYMIGSGPSSSALLWNSIRLNFGPIFCW